METDAAKLADPGTKGEDVDEAEAIEDVLEEESQPSGQLMSSEMNRSWFNMVCYGVPNLMVTQLSKP